MSSDEPRDGARPDPSAREVWPSTRRPPTRWALASFLYARALALVSICAFGSLAVQIEGLYGESGLTPIAPLFAALRTRGEIGFLDLPTLAWLSASATTLRLLCATGVVASVLLFVGILPRGALVVAWASYLSLVNAGMPWTAFQWDLLLVEVLLASTLFVPTARIDRFDPRAEPGLAGRWLIWLVLFRLMLRSGIVKLASGDPTWADLTALEYHFATQPLPTVLGWYAAHLPLALDRIGCALMFGVELGLPFLIFVPRRAARRTAAAGFAGLMAAIALTGNYGFFNLLALVLAATLVDDDVWARVVPGRPVRPRTARASPTRRTRLGTALATLLAGLGMLGFASGLGGRGLAPRSDPLAALRPFRSLNDYGLFAVMTTRRREIELEGSHDGRDWKPIRFRYKVGPLDRAPVWCAPHQPRLDWQMWFAALDPGHSAPWLERLMEGLVVGDEAMLGLLADGSPSSDPAPRFVRATLWEYHPTDLAEHARTGDWWTRERIGPYGVSVMRGARDGT